MEKQSTPPADPPPVPDGHILLDPAHTAVIRQQLQTGRMGTYATGDVLGDYAREVDDWHAAVDGNPYATAYGRSLATKAAA